MKHIVKWIYAFILLLLLGVFGFSYAVREGSAAIVTRFGRIHRVDQEAGLKTRLPWPFDRVVSLDTRRQYFDSGHTETLTRDKKNIILQTYMVWMIDDPALFYTSVGNAQTAVGYVGDLLSNAKNGVLGAYDLSALVSTDQREIRISQIEKDLMDAVAPKAHRDYGILVDTIGIKRIALPEANVKNVLEQMRADRQKTVTTLLSEGTRDADIIRSQADAQAAEIVAEGNTRAAEIHAQTQGEIARIHAEAYQKNPGLFSFLMKMEALEAAASGNATLVLEMAESPFEVLMPKEEKYDD